jgi:hypothetical protein
VWAWLQTVALVTFRPIHAARRVATPDRLAASFVFAGACIILAAALLSLCSAWSGGLTFRAAEWWIAPVPSWQQPLGPALLSLNGLLGGLAVCMLAWCTVLGLAVLVGIGVANVVCRRRAAAFRCAARWCCFASVVWVWGGLVSTGYWSHYAWQVASAAAKAKTGSSPPVAPAWPGPGVSVTPALPTTWPAISPFVPGGLFAAPILPPSAWMTASDEPWRAWTDLSPTTWPAIVAYGLWLAVGLACSPHRDRRPGVVLALALGAYGLCWALLSQAIPWWVISLAVR